MAKKRHHLDNNIRFEFFINMTRKRIITYGIIVAIISGVGIVGYNSMSPTNGNTPIFDISINHFVKAKYSAGSGYAWVSLSSSSSKGLKSTRRGGGGGPTAATVNRSYVLAKGGLQSIHIVNKDYETHSKQNFNIDEFKVHS
jgi:hypothetical protein